MFVQLTHTGGKQVSRKHNVKHLRSASNYKLRLRKRGLSRTPTMTPYDAERLAAIHRREDEARKKSGRSDAIHEYLEAVA